ncbi:unnamed protein product, partial [Ectocarpus sp. 12 AP-2014]
SPSTAPNQPSSSSTAVVGSCSPPSRPLRRETERDSPAAAVAAEVVLKPASESSSMATKLAPFPSALFPRGSSPPQPRDRATEARNKEGAPRTAPSHPRTPNRAPSSSSLEPEPCSPRHGPPS